MGTIQNLEKALKTHDWYYEFSDDHRVFTKGTAELKNIYNLIGQVDKKTAGKLWNKYAPKNKAAGNKPMFPFPKHLVKEDSTPGGKGDKTSEDEVCPKQLKVGIAVEKEHTNNPQTAKEIAIDHLVEDPEYYSKLIKSGLADEPEALKLAKEFGMNESLQMRKLRSIIKEVVRDLLEAKYMDEKQALAAMKKGKIISLYQAGGVQNLYRMKGNGIQVHDGTRWMPGKQTPQEFLDFEEGETQFKVYK
jgi:hypothetical protein